MSTLETKIPNLDTQKRIASALEKIAGDGLTAWNLEVNHPVGSTWESIYPNNPANILGGGTWKQLKDVTIVAAGDTFKVSDLDTNQDGGEAEHTLTVDEMPNIHGSLVARVLDGNATTVWIDDEGNLLTGVRNGGTTYYLNQAASRNSSNYKADIIKFNFGKNSAHNNMGPYKVLYKWIRTA